MNARFLAGNPSTNIFLERDCSLDFASAGSMASECDEKMFMDFEKCAELGPLRSTWSRRRCIWQKWRLDRRWLVPLGRLMPPGVALEGLGRPICTPSVLSEKRDISFACSRATTRHRNRSGGPLGVAAGRLRVMSEACAKAWALKSPSAARTDRYAVEDGCGGVGGRLRTGVRVTGDNVRVSKPNLHFSSG